MAKKRRIEEAKDRKVFRGMNDRDALYMRIFYHKVTPAVRRSRKYLFALVMLRELVTAARMQSPDRMEELMKSAEYLLSRYASRDLSAYSRTEVDMSLIFNGMTETWRNVLASRKDQADTESL